MVGLERHWILALMIGLPGAPAAHEEHGEAWKEVPELDLLDYLGSWQDDDEKWFVDAEISAEREDESRRNVERGEGYDE
jgi:hypothetical protein